MSKEGIRRTCCPLCGSPIEVSWLYQYSRNYRFNKTGELSKRCKIKDCGPMEVAIASCIRTDTCTATWEDGDFDIDSNRYFIDYKYR